MLWQKKERTKNIIRNDLMILGDIALRGMGEMIAPMRHHVQEVARFSTLIAQKIKLTSGFYQQLKVDFEKYGLDPSFFVRKKGQQFEFTRTGVYLVQVCALMHDIGKPFFREIYALQRKLGQEEYMTQKTHVVLTRLIVRAMFKDEWGLENENLVNFIADNAGSHHEKYDGSGYPNQQAGKDILWIGRLLAIPDAISAKINNRPYNEPVSLSECLKILETDVGTHFDHALFFAAKEALDGMESRITGDWVNPKKLTADYLRMLKIVQQYPGLADSKAMEEIESAINRSIER